MHVVGAAVLLTRLLCGQEQCDSPVAMPNGTAITADGGGVGPAARLHRDFARAQYGRIHHLAGSRRARSGRLRAVPKDKP